MKLRYSAAIAFAIVCGLATPTATAQSTSGVDLYNQELQDIWTRLRPALENRINIEAHANLEGFRHRTGIFRITVDRVRDPRLVLEPAPGFSQMDPTRIAVRIPRAGDWDVRVEARVKVRIRVGFIRHTVRIPIELRVKDLAASAAVIIDWADPARPVVQRIERPQVDFEVKVRSSAYWWNLLFRILSPIGNLLAQRVLGDALDDLTQSMTSLAGLPGPIPGDGAAPYTDSGTPTPFEEVVTNVDRKTRRDNMPHGTILRAQMDTPAHDSWLDAYRNGGTGNPGQPTSWNGGGDSAIFTGHWLAAQSYRYHATGDPEALDNVRYVMWGMGNLIDINGSTGLLARVTAPTNSRVGQDEIVNRWVHGRRIMHGEEWVGRNDQGSGGKGITRDQYSGAFYGLAVAHDFVNDPAVQADAALRIQQMLDYIVGHDWYIDEDRQAFDGTDRKGFPTFWLGIEYQRLAFLHIGERVAPGRYASELQRWGPLSEGAWIGMWLSTMNVEHMYKFNLQAIGVYNYFRLETDQQRWQDLHRGYRITQRYIGHHRNPHFDLVQTSIDPSLNSTLHPCVRESIRRFLSRNHRVVAPPVVDLSGVTWVTLTMPSIDRNSLSLPGFGSLSSSGSGVSTSRTVTLPSEPLDIPLQKYTGHFLWQKGPFRPATAGVGDPLQEATGVDLTLPYWHGRDQGAF